MQILHWMWSIVLNRHRAVVLSHHEVVPTNKEHISEYYKCQKYPYFVGIILALLAHYSHLHVYNTIYSCKTVT